MKIAWEEVWRITKIALTITGAVYLISAFISQFSPSVQAGVQTVSPHPVFGKADAPTVEDATKIASETADATAGTDAFAGIDVAGFLL